MQMELPPSNFIGSIQWLSELGMEDPLLARSIDGLLSTGQASMGREYEVLSMATSCGGQYSCSSNQLHSNSSNGAGILMGLQEPLKRPLGAHSTSDPQLRQPAATQIIGYERLQKIPKLNPWDVSCSQQLYGDIAPSSQLSHSSSSSGNNICDANAKEPRLSPHLSASSHTLESLLASFSSTLKDESLAPRTPTFQLEMGFSHVSGRQEGSLMDVHSVVSTAPAKDVNASSPSSINQMLNYLPMGKPVQGSPAPLKPAGNSQDHIMAERKRREKLSQRFIALSAIVPGLKKMDKASVLGDAIKYVKQLQERLKTLEEQAPKTVSVAMQKSQHGTSTLLASDFINKEINSQGQVNQPDIEVRMIDKNVLIRVHCEKKKGLLLKSLGELEKLQLSIVNANILLFSETTLDLTFTAQVEEGCELTADDIVKALQDFFKKLK